MPRLGERVPCMAGQAATRGSRPFRTGRNAAVRRGARGTGARGTTPGTARLRGSASPRGRGPNGACRSRRVRASGTGPLTTGQASSDGSPPTGHHGPVAPAGWIHWFLHPLDSGFAGAAARVGPHLRDERPDDPRTRCRTRPPACGKGRDLGPLTLVNHPGEGFHGRSGARPPADSPRPAGSSAGFPGGLSGGAGTFRRRPTFFPTPATMSEPGTTLSTHHVTRGDGLEKAP